MAAEPCPCSSGLKYKACCEPFLLGREEPPTPEALMRSRYSAFAKKAVEHLVRTLDGAHPDKAKDTKALTATLLRAMRDVRYLGLEVLGARGPDADGVAQVVFVARLFEKGVDRSFAERSDFRHDGKGWRYWRGVAKPADAVRSAADPWAVFGA